MTDWLGGYSSTWEVRTVNTATWEDGAALPGVRSVTVEKSGEGDSPTIESATMTLDTPDGAFESGWYRISMIAAQGGRERVPIATLMFERLSNPDLLPREVFLSAGLLVRESTIPRKRGRK